MKTTPDRLEPQECKRNVRGSKPPILYIPDKDVIQEAVDSSANTRKLTLPHKVELCVKVWLKGTPKQFLVHIQQALDAIKQKSFLAAMTRWSRIRRSMSKH